VTEVVGLTEHLQKKPQFLSGGERQRVALARAMVKKPQVFLMDEPLSNLDAKLRQQLRSELIELHHRLGVTFVYVTHDQVEAMSMGTKIVLLDAGKIMQQDTAHRIYNYQQNIFSSRFIGAPPMNILACEQAREYAKTPFLGGAQHLGFRPEKVKLESESTGENAALHMHGMVVGIELLGAELLYTVELSGKKRIAVKIMDDVNAKHCAYGDEIALFVSSNNVVYFDENEQRICCEDARESEAQIA
jgi:sn-glycerol 3-phosphate transport system ATP-binding protein